MKQVEGMQKEANRREGMQRKQMEAKGCKGGKKKQMDALGTPQILAGHWLSIQISGCQSNTAHALI